VKIRKTVTDKVIAANRENGTKGGPKTPEGKDRVSQNAAIHGILARNLHFEDDQEKADYEKLISRLKRSIDRHDPLQRVLAEEFATACVRRGRAFRFFQKSSRRKSPATSLAVNALEDSELVGTSDAWFDSDSGWQCEEMHVCAKSDAESRARNGPVAQGGGHGQELQVHAKFQDPFDKALRYERATGRDLYRALNALLRFRSNPKPDPED
jgi:hypothetical protein